MVACITYFGSLFSIGYRLVVLAAGLLAGFGCVGGQFRYEIYTGAPLITTDSRCNREPIRRYNVSVKY